MNYIERDIFKELKKHLSLKQAIILTGLRRTGKTTLVKKLLEMVKSTNKIYIDLENLGNRNLFSEENYDNIISGLQSYNLTFKKKAYIAIDEIQFLPKIVSVIKYLYDRYDIKFILTGSSSYYIKNLFTESLSGRKKIFILNTLSFGEFLRFKGENRIKNTRGILNFNRFNYERLKNFYNEYLHFGGFPEVTLTSQKQQKKDLLNDILGSYLRTDIKAFTEIRDERNISNLLKMLAASTGSKIDYTKLSSLTGISRPTLYNYLYLFENTFLIHRLKVYSKSINRQIVKAPKLYICDNGILNVLARVSSGTIFENSIFNQLKHYGQLNYWQEKSGNEIDFILDSKFAYESKESSGNRDYEKLKRFSGILKLKNPKIIVKNPPKDFNEFLWGGDIL